MVELIPDKPTNVVRDEAAIYAHKANRLIVQHSDGVVVAIIEIVSPGNKASRDDAQAVARKAVAFLQADVHLLIVDLSPPSKRDPRGVHGLIWDRIQDDPYELPSDKQLSVASYVAASPLTAYVEPLAVGDRLPDMPIFLTPERYVPCPLEATYIDSWAAFPHSLKGPLEASTPTNPEPK